MNILIWFIIIGICAFILLITLFSIVVGVSFSLGMRNKDDAHYDPETKQWYAMVELSEEQQSRIVVGKRRLLRRNIEPKKTLRSVMWLVAIVLIICIVVMLICNQIVVNNAKGKVFSDIDSIKHNKVGLLLGTTPQARIGRITNYFFIYRIDAAEQLYKARKIEKILISGDEHSLDGVNEPESMRDSLENTRGQSPCEHLLLLRLLYDNTICIRPSSRVWRELAHPKARRTYGANL